MAAQLHLSTIMENSRRGRGSCLRGELRDSLKMICGLTQISAIFIVRQRRPSGVFPGRLRNAVDLSNASGHNHGC